ncbi:inositolphosphorylceramide-B C-26 hydroxylase [Cordyceps militaris CM01]|uniref:Ceramide very long chain fatty acid hydroxylase n=2 Tax=Cordyceps militaris TaxID=73501 RepID=G3J697_CORMM|nr:inositolphosphorylceramide-B C-26 hydroxylase [Cordyceps militaris CM01]ATY63916.1 fatty acid hydroxylase [Cordyceps militaris]EGX96996.1 inositolphosphorylceramide-B C-26 hydroxylase [Cordyceps militaris CM01]
MPSRTLPTFSRAEVESHSSTDSCYVTIGTKVYDVTNFADDHPGGSSLVLEYAGKDVRAILNDPTSHEHSEAAYEILDDSLVGFVTEKNVPNGHANGSATTAGTQELVHPRTGMSCAEDLSKDTDIGLDYKKHKFLDLDKPLFLQVWNGGFTKDFYLDQVHRPRHYRGGDSAPLFGNFLEPLSKTPWWLVPIIWLPCVAFGLYSATEDLPGPYVAAYWLFGCFLWTLIEYGMHRFLFHLDGYLPDNRVFITLHFLFHGIHHYLPMDKYRLVMPPTLFIFLATPFWYLSRFVFYHSWHTAVAVFCGGVFGYICYDLTHYFLHHENLPLWYKQLKKYHLQHHFLDYELGFGVTSKFWDTVFGTELNTSIKTK